MKIFSTVLDYERLLWAREFELLGHRFEFDQGKPIFDIFRAYKPDLVLYNNNTISRPLMKCLSANVNTIKSFNIDRHKLPPSYDPTLNLDLNPQAKHKCNIAIFGTYHDDDDFKKLIRPTLSYGSTNRVRIYGNNKWPYPHFCGFIVWGSDELVQCVRGAIECIYWKDIDNPIPINIMRIHQKFSPPFFTKITFPNAKCDFTIDETFHPSNRIKQVMEICGV